MRIEVIDTGSAANCYALTNADGDILLLDAGVAWGRINAALGASVSRIVGALITHEHKDHSRACSELERRGIDVYASDGTMGAIHCGTSRRANFRPIDTGQTINARGFRFVAFRVKHDAAEPFGFLVEADGERLAYITDAPFIPCALTRLKYLVSECNYTQAQLCQSSADAPMGLLERVIQSHMSAETLAAYVGTMDVSIMSKIILVHISNARGHDADMVRMIHGAARGVPVYAALPGAVYD